MDISISKNEWLTREVTENKVSQAVKQVGSLKAPGLDDLHAMFYQKYWSILNKSTFRMIKAFLFHGHLLKELNNNHYYSKLLKKVGINLLVCVMYLISYSKLLANNLSYGSSEGNIPFSKCFCSQKDIMIIF